jgi:catechol-2,3-dioxygenase
LAGAGQAICYGQPKAKHKGLGMSRVTEIRYVGYGVKDLAAEQAFYLDQWGLEQVPSDDGMVWFC